MAMSNALPRALSGEEVARLDQYALFAVLGKRVIHPGGCFGACVTAVDIAPLMLERAARNVASAGLGDRVSVDYGDITGLNFANHSFDRVIAEAVTMFVDRAWVRLYSSAGLTDAQVKWPG